MFTKQEIIDRRRQEMAEEAARGETPRPGKLNLALLILSSALYKQRQWSGDDYAEHPLYVALTATRSTTKQIIGILHDVVEDSDWELDDLRACGFSERVVKGVEGVTKRDGEKYLDFVERCSLNPDSIDVKINDLEHNSTNTRNAAFPTEKALEKQKMYVISYQYLVAVKKGEVKPGSSISDFIATRPALTLANDLMAKYSSRYRQSPAPTPRPNGPW